MQSPQEDSGPSSDHGRPAGGDRSKLTKAAAAAALLRVEEEAAKKRAAKAKDERAREAARKAEEDEILAKKSAAAAASEALEAKQAIKLEAAREAAIERAAEAHVKHYVPDENNGVNASSAPSHNFMETTNATSNKSILEKSSVENMDLGKQADGETHTISYEKARQAREAARKAEEREIEAKKRTAAAKGEELERTEAIKSAQAREAARLAAEERAARGSHKSQDYSKNTSSSSHPIIPEKETASVREKQYYMMESSKDTNSRGKHEVTDIHGNTGQAMLNFASGSLKTASREKEEKEIVSVSNATHTLLEGSEENVIHGNYKRTKTHNRFEEEISGRSIDQGSRQKMMSDYTEDYHAQQSETRPKDRTIEYSKHANSSQSAQIDNLSNAITITAEQKQRFRHSSEKETVSVTGDEKNISNESTKLARNENQKSRYFELGSRPKVNDTYTEQSKQEHNLGFEGEHYPGGGRAMGVSESHRHHGKHSYRTQYHCASPPKKNSGFESSQQQRYQRNPTYQHHQQQHEQQHSNRHQQQHEQHYSTYQHQQQQHHHHPNSKRHQTHYKYQNYHAQEQKQQRTSNRNSSRRLICGSCNEKYNSKEKLPRSLVCGHTICTPCIEDRTNPDFSITCPQCPIETMHIRDPEHCPVNQFLMNKVLEETQQDVSMEGIQDRNRPHSFSGGDSRWSRPQHGNYSRQRSSTKQSMSKSERVERNVRSPHESKCFEMAVRPSHYCSACNVWVCAKCAEVDHMYRKCSLKPLKDQLTEMKKQHDLTGKRTQELLNKSLQNLENDCDQEKIFHLWMEAAFECMEKRQENTKKTLQEGRALMNTLTDVMGSLTNAQNLPDALTTFQILEDIADEAHQWSSSAERGGIGADKEITDCLKSLMKRTLKSLQVKSGISEMCALDKVPGGELFSELRVDGGRFHLHALRKDKPFKHEARALPLQCFTSSQDATSMLVFLDLSWGGKCRGRLYIRLTGDTLRGRQFVSLCTGEGGVSFCGTFFHRVWWKGLPGEHIWTGDYENCDGSGGRTHPLFSRQLQVPAGREVPIAEGLVAGRYEKKNISSVFRIYTRGEKEVRDQAAFGQVEFGLDVVKEAVRLKDITEVVISDCGLVLEM